MYSHTLDTIGWYGRSVDDLILVAGAFRLPGIQTASVPVELRGLHIGLCRSPQWEHAEPAMLAALQAAGERLESAGAHVHELELPEAFARLAAAQEIIMHGEGRAAFLPEFSPPITCSRPTSATRSRTCSKSRRATAGKLRAGRYLPGRVRSPFQR